MPLTTWGLIMTLQSTKLLPYNMGSASARALAQELGIRRVYPNRNYRPQEGHKVINWGRGGSPTWDASIPSWFNKPAYVNRAGNKLLSLRDLEAADVSSISYTTDIDKASDWLDEDIPVVVRHQLRGHSGQGIEMIYDPARLPEAPLYTKYQKKTHEYRVHVLPCGKTVLNQKRRRRDVPDEDVNWQVRNYGNGFTYCRDNVEDNEYVRELGKRAVKALGLDFGAVDIIHHAPSDTTMVLEVNTAPGLEGSLIQSYVESFRSVL